MTLTRVVRAKLERMKRDLLHFVTLRRRETALAPYLLRLFVMAMLLVVLPVKYFVQLGLVGGVLALLKVGFAGAVVLIGLVSAFAIGEILRRRGRRTARPAKEAAA